MLQLLFLLLFDRIEAIFKWKNLTRRKHSIDLLLISSTMSQSMSIANLFFLLRFSLLWKIVKVRISWGFWYLVWHFYAHHFSFLFNRTAFLKCVPNQIQLHFSILNTNTYLESNDFATLIYRNFTKIGKLPKKTRVYISKGYQLCQHLLTNWPTCNAVLVSTRKKM